MRSLTTALCFAALAAGLLAQSTTVSPSNAPNSNNNYPYNYNPCRYMQIHDAAGFTGQTPLILKGMTYAPWRNTTSTGTVEVMVKLALAKQGTTSANAVSAYDSNIDSATLKTVIARKKINIQGGNANAFVVKFPFDSGVTFPWVPSLGRSMCVETRFYSGKASFPFAAWSGLNLNNGSSVTNGSYNGCLSTSGKTVRHYGISAYLKADGQYGKNNYFYGYAYKQSVPGVMTLGAKTLNVTLPGGQCVLVNDILILGIGQTDTSSNGRMTIQFPIPKDQNLVGVKFLTQMFFVDAGLNLLNVSATRGLINTIGKGMLGVQSTVCRIYAFSSNPDTITAGTVGRNFGLITQFNN